MSDEEKPVKKRVVRKRKAKRGSAPRRQRLAKTRDVFFSRKGERISSEAWKELREDPEYIHVRRFENDTILVDLVWVGHVPAGLADIMYSEQWEIFQLNYYAKSLDDEGVVQYRQDKTMTDTFGRENVAIGAYETIVEKYTESYFDVVQSDEGHESMLIEVDNMWAPELKEQREFIAAHVEDEIAGSW